MGVARTPFPTLRATLGLVLLASALPAAAGSHTWVVNEAFSNADGTIQFVELANGATAGETGLAAKAVTSAVEGTIHTFAANLPANSSANKKILLGTAAFAALPGAPTPDHIIAANSFSLSADTLQWHVYTTSRLIWTAGQFPTDGVTSWNRTTGSAGNTPTNFAGQSGSVNASPTPPAVPDGSAGAPVTVVKLDPLGTDLEVTWDASTCTGMTDHVLIFGSRSQLPAVPGGVYGLDGGVCAMGVSSPFTWIGAPEANDGSGLLWWLIVARNGAMEGSWGRDSSALERNGNGTNGSSGQCGGTDKSTTNACGH